MLEIKMNNVENNTGTSPGVDKTLSRILRGMLRTVYGYAKDKPEQVYLYARINNDSSSTLVPIFEIKGKRYELNELHEASYIDEKTQETIDFDFDKERKLSLHKYLGKDLLSDAIPLLRFHQIKIPDEIWFSYEILNDSFNIEVSYSCSLYDEGENNTKEFEFSVEKRIADWLDSLNNPENKTFINVYDYPDLLGEDFMLELN